MLLSLPPEIVLRVLGNLEPADILRLASGCHTLHDAAFDENLWRALYDARWPAWTTLSESTLDLSQEPWMHRYELRHLGRMHLALRDDERVLLLAGSATDTYDGNVTPYAVSLCRPPENLLQPFEQQDPHRLVLGEAQYGQGSKHNEPRRNTLLGNANGQAIEWREHTGSFGHWVYKGHLASDGRTVTGSFHMSCLPRKKGTFSLQAVDPATTAEDSRAWWASVTRASLTRRVIVKWAVGSIEKRARQQELIAEAAAQVVAAPGAQ